MKELTKCALCGEDVAVHKYGLKLDDHKWICEGCVKDLWVDVEDELNDEFRYLRKRWREVGY